jgi:hypothetical protein
MLSKDDVINALCTGFLKGSERYVRWSGGDTVHDAGIEFLATATIAEQFVRSARKRDPDSWISLEMPFSDVGEYANAGRPARRGRRPAVFGGRPRVDIAYYDKSEYVRGIIEVKRHLDYFSLRDDAERIYWLIKHYGKPHGTLKFGCVLAIRPIASWQKKTIEDVASEIAEKFKSDFDCSISVRVRNKPLRADDRIEYEEEGKERKIRGFGIACFYFRNKRASD